MSRRPPARRLRGVLAVLVIGLAGIATRIGLLQALDADELSALGKDQRIRELSLPAARGSILDRTGRELAISVDAKAVYADPGKVRKPRRTAARVARVLGVRRGRIARALEKDAPFVYLARRVDVERTRELEALDLDGIGFLDETRRYYPGESLAAQVLGFVGVDGAGLAGLELEYDEVLAGTPGKMVVEQDPMGRAIPQGIRRIQEPVPGTSVVLTIDRDLQWQAQRALAAAVRESGAKGGTVLIMDPRTGEVLAMATHPWFDANDFQTADPSRVRNRAVTDVYEPGSVNKVITAAGALEDGAIGPAEAIEVPGSYRVGDKVFRDVEEHGPEAMTISDILTRSSNVGTIKVAERLGRDRLSRWLTRFGFGRKTKIDFPGEARGILLPRDEWWVTSMGTIPMGQGIAVTPLQMTSVFATIANDGVRARPRLVRGTVGPDGRLRPAESRRERRVVSEGTARRVREILARVVEEGTGRLAQVPGYRVGGKTGTARKPLKDALGYSDEFVASFIGLAPAEDPAVVVAAILDEPDTVYGGVASAPLFRRVVRFAMAELRVPPTEAP